MKIYHKQNVWDAALDRIRALFDEFPNIVVNFSGGKDSTVTLQLALMVAEEKGRLPLTVLFLDQESEWRATIEYVRETMDDPRIRPLWIQCPFQLANSTSTEQDWLQVWSEDGNWMRDKEPDSVKENLFGTRTFADLFNGIVNHFYPEGNVAKLAGVRTEESPSRFKGLTTYETWGGRTWGKVEDKKRHHFTFYPLYDWSYTDVWKAIHDNGWAYNEVYNYQYRYGVPVQNMRVSSLNHETALPVLYYLQEVEPDTWEALTHRLQGINTVGHMKKQFMAPKELPPMFVDWAEYRDHLLKNLVHDPAKRAIFEKQFREWCARYEPHAQKDLIRTQIKAVLTDDYHGTALSVFAAKNGRNSINRGSKGGDLSERWDIQK